MSSLQMNDQAQLMSQYQMLNSELVSQPAMVNQMNPPQMMNLMVSQPQMVAQPSMLNQSKMMPHSYGNWAQQQPLNMPPMNSMKFPNQMNTKYGGAKSGRSNWKGKKVMDSRRKDVRRKDVTIPAGGGSVGYKPPSLTELEHQNRLKAGRFYHKKKFNRMGPYAHAPRNTTSYLIRAKKEGGIASLVSPCPVTPAVLPTPVFSPSREALVDMAKEEWGVDGYGSMKGLIRLRSSSPGHEAEMDDYEDEDEGDSSESDVEEHLEVERRLDHDLSRFEMIYPNFGTEYTAATILENRVDDQDTHIAQLEEENLSLKERLYLMERELVEIKRRMQCLERQGAVEEIHEELTENVSENESEEGTTRVNSVAECEGALENEHHEDESVKNHFVDTKVESIKDAACGEMDAGLDLAESDNIGNDGEMDAGIDLAETGKIANGGEMDAGIDLAETDKIGNAEAAAAEDLRREDTTPHNEPEIAPSEHQ